MTSFLLVMLWNRFEVWSQFK